MTTDSKTPPARAAATAHVIVIEDESDIRDIVTYNLRRAGFSVSGAASGSLGLELVRTSMPDLVILDLMLPGIDGVGVCRQLRENPATRSLPVIMLTARDAESDIVRGLESGADDYMTKPFSPRELVARVQALLRRNMPEAVRGDAQVEASTPANIVLAGGVVSIHRARHEVIVDGRPVQFTATEFRLIVALAERAGHVLGRDRLVAQVMGDDAWITERTIDVHVRAIRRKLGSHARLIETIRGVGYRALDERPSASDESEPSRVES